MALISYVLGDCPSCGAVDSYGNVDVYGMHVRRACKRCRFREDIALPRVRKKVLYLDQFFFSHAFRGRDEQFVRAARLVARLASLQLLVAPFSSGHEDETHQWERRDELFRFIKDSARGHELDAAYNVESAQILKGFEAWRSGQGPTYALAPQDALSREVHQWDSYFRIEVGRYRGDVELIRDLKAQSVEALVGLFAGWRTLRTSYSDDLAAEYRDAALSYLDAFRQFVVRIGEGDYNALLDAPISSTIVQDMMQMAGENSPVEERVNECLRFFASEHFRKLPYQWISAHMFATLKDMVKHGAYANRDRALQRLSGVFFDVKHIATYAPYADAFVMDQPMADLCSRVKLEERFGTKVFSRNNWDAFICWLESLEADMTRTHRQGLAAAYPRVYSRLLAETGGPRAAASPSPNS